ARGARHSGGAAAEVLAASSKRTGQVAAALGVRGDEFRGRAGRDPTRWERAALCREAAADTRAHKTGHGGIDLRTRWQTEADTIGWDRRPGTPQIATAGPPPRCDGPRVTIDQVLDELSTRGSTWTRADVMRVVCDLSPTVSPMSGQRWTTALDGAVDRVIGYCTDLDPTDARVVRRASDGRSVWLEPTAARYTSEAILTQEERIGTSALDAQTTQPILSSAIRRSGLARL